MRRIPIAGPSITEREVDYVSRAVRDGWYANANEFIWKFEEAFAAHAGRRYGVTLPSCTAGLHLALAAHGVGPGDEVIVPDCTWIASCAPISYVGATPVFVDIDAATWCLSPEAFEAAVTPRTKAVIVVDLYGHMPDWDGILAVAERHGIVVIEDAAEATGSRFRDRPAGNFGACSVFSFHGSKTLTTGEGGMIVCDDDALHDRIQKLRDHGRVAGDIMFFNDEVAFKYKMSAVQAALGLAQLERLDELVAKKRQIFQWYRDRLETSNLVSLNPDQEHLYNSYWMSTAIVEPRIGLTKEALVPAMREAGVDVRPFFYPLSDIPAYRNAPGAAVARDRNAVSRVVSRTGINLPSALSLAEADVELIVTTLRDVIDAHRGR